MTSSRTQHRSQYVADDVLIWPMVKKFSRAILAPLAVTMIISGGGGAVTVYVMTEVQKQKSIQQEAAIADHEARLRAMERTQTSMATDVAVIRQILEDRKHELEKRP